MSKYHKGDKFIVEIKEVMNSVNGTLYRSEFSTLTFDDYGLDKLEQISATKSEETPTLPNDEKHEIITEAYEYAEAYNKGLNDAWELAKKIVSNPGEGGFSVKELINIFETSLMKNVFNEYSAQEAIEIIEAYEKEQAEIKVGDVVENINTGEAIVLEMRKDGLLNIITLTNGEVRIGWHQDVFKKTGKHIDIQSVLQQIGGGSGES